MGESPIEVSSQPPPPPHHKLPSHNQLPISQHHRHHPRQPLPTIIKTHRPNMSFIQIILYRCRFRDFRCSLMVGSVLGRNLKDRPVFGRKKWKNVSVGARWRCYGRGKIAPRLLPRLVLCDQCAPLVQPPLTRLPRVAFFTFFSTPGRPSKSQDRNL